MPRLYCLAPGGGRITVVVKHFETVFYTTEEPDPALENMSDVTFHPGVRKRSADGYQSDATFYPISSEKPYLLKRYAQQNSLNTFELYMDVLLQFTRSLDISVMSWIRIGVGSVTRSILNVDFKNISKLDRDDVPESFRILSFDIECIAQADRFPQPTMDPITQIACQLNAYGQNADEYIHEVVFCLDTSDPVDQVDVRCFETEQELMRSFVDYINESDPDVLTGYNIVLFDLPYIIDRLHTLEITPSFSRIPGMAVDHRELPSGKTTIGCPGRNIIDMFMVIKRDYQLRSFKLNSVASHFLGETKADVAYNMMRSLQEGTSTTRAVLVHYCMRDAKLPWRLACALMTFGKYIELARITGVTINQLIFRGQTIRIISMLSRYAGREGYVLPDKLIGFRETMLKDGLHANVMPERGDDGPAYQGATVLDPICDFYKTPISVMDFASLYPNIIRAFNICITTLLNPGHSFGETQIDTSPTGQVFVKSDIHEGLLPKILRVLLSERKRVKSLMKAEADPFKKSVLDAQQLAIKVCCNSVYGFLGANAMTQDLAASVTSFGREMILQTKAFVEDNCPGSKVIYGDTDSVFVAGIGPTGDVVDRISEEVCERITKEVLRAPNVLEFEKHYVRMLLVSKKRYCGSMPDGTLDTKGLESKRRDNARVVSETMEKVLDIILHEGDTSKAVAYVQRVVSNILMCRVDMSDLIISKALRNDYAVPQPHSEVARKRAKRDPADRPTVGERVPFVWIEAPAKSKKRDIAEVSCCS